MENKIIHWTYRSYKASFASKGDPYFYLGGWATLQAKGVARFIDEIKQEVWRPEYEVDKKETGYVDNIKGKLFPQGQFGRKYHLNPVSLLKELRRECKKNKVVINLHCMHDPGSQMIIFLCRKYPIVVHHHGSIPFRYRQLNKNILKKLLNRILIRIDEYLLKKVDYFSVISKIEKEYLLNFIDPEKIKLEQGRKYFKEWQPIEKKVARKKIGIDVHKKVIIYIGYYYELKGLDNLLAAFDELKKKYDTELILIGGRPTDPLYDQVISSGAIEYGRIPNTELIFYYSASDVYVFYSEDENLVKYGGLGTSPIEAMACDVPVVSSQLIHFPENEWNKVGEIPKNREDMITCIEKIFEKPENYSPRKTSKKYYDFEKILNSNISVYKNLIKKYYEQ